LKGGRKVATKILSKNTIKKKTIKDMTSLGVYKKEYDNVINVYVDTLDQYQRALLTFENGGFQYETETAAGGTKKSAIAATLENLRKDIAAYSNLLCLNPKAIESVTTNGNKESKLASLLSDLR
jgi:phage terminase small subunit